MNIHLDRKFVVRRLNKRDLYALLFFYNSINTDQNIRKHYRFLNRNNILNRAVSYLYIRSLFRLQKLYNLIGKNTVFFASINLSDSNIAGISHLSIDRSNSFAILGLAVLSEHAGQGLGKELLSDAIEFGKNFGLQKILLEVDIDNYRARHVYEKLCFKVTNSLPRHKVFRTRLPNSVWMELEL